MTRTATLILIALALFVAAAGVRFYRLGDWSFAGDELATFAETDALFGRSSAPADSQEQRLPRMVPLAFVLHAIGYDLFGRDEFGSRVLPALVGGACVVVVFLGLDGPLARAAALATALLTAMWPEHLFQSQQNRFYILAAFFAAACLAAGARAVWRRSTWWALTACVSALAATLCHTLAGLLLPLLLVGFVAAPLAERKPMSWPMLAVVAASAIAAGTFGWFYLKPLAHGWNADGDWGYGPVHSLGASVLQVGWPVAVLALVGAAGLWSRRRGQAAYWLVAALTWAVASVVLPGVVVYHPAYVFPLALGVVVQAGFGIGVVFQALRDVSLPAAVAWFVAALLLPLPGVVSHYADGSRHDYRAAALVVAKAWKPGDRLAAVSPGLIHHYAPLEGQTVLVSPGNPLPRLEELTRSPGRAWVVLPGGRGGRSAEVDEWLRRHCTLERSIRAWRLDYHDFILDVYLYPGPGG